MRFDLVARRGCQIVDSHDSVMSFLDWAWGFGCQGRSGRIIGGARGAWGNASDQREGGKGGDWKMLFLEARALTYRLLKFKPSEEILTSLVDAYWAVSNRWLGSTYS